MNRRAWLALALAGGVRAEVPPPTRLLVAYPPGGVSDEAARALAGALAARSGGVVTVENRPGAGGTIAMEALARSRPDGHTLCLSAITPLTLSPLLGKALPDVVPVVAVMQTPPLLVATRAFDGQSFADVVVQARAAPGRLRWATSGIATTGHLILEQVRAARGIDITHVPYKGGGAQLNDALGGQFELLLTNVGALQLGYVRDGRLRPLAVGSPSRVDALPAVPTFAELGIPRANRGAVFGVFAPAGTPPAVIAALNEAINRALAAPGFTQRLRAAGSVPMGGSAHDLAQQVLQESEENRILLR